MIDPISALEGLQSAISMVKKASKVASDLGSLAPMLGKMFDAKSQCTKALLDAKKNKGSNMGQALQIEMALEQARAFEEELKMLFMQTGKIDVWNKIKSRAAAMDVEAAHDARKEKEAAAKHKKEIDEVIELALLGLVFTALLGIILYFTFSILEQRG
jgi:hypothetical protein